MRTPVSPELPHESKLRGGGQMHQVSGHTDRSDVRKEGGFGGVATRERGRVAAQCGVNTLLGDTERATPLPVPLWDLTTTRPDSDRRGNT